MAQPSSGPSQVDEVRARKYLTYSRWVWLVGSAVSVVIAAITAMVIVEKQGLAIVVLVIGCVQAAIAAPAALALRKRANWARVTLFVLALFSLISLYQAFKLDAWPTVVIEVILGSTAALLCDKNVIASCESPAARQH